MMQRAKAHARRKRSMYRELWRNNKPAFFGAVILGILKWALLLIILVFTVGPIIWVILSSFKTNFELFNSSFALPESWNLDNYRRVFELDDLGRAFINTIIVAGLSTFLCLIIAAMAAYAFKYQFRHKSRINMLVVMGIYIPVNAFMIPYFVIANTMGIYNTIWALILTYTATGMPLSIIVLKSYMDTIPNDLMESATIDGCGFFRCFTKVMLPLSAPGLATIGIFQFVTAWNEFLYATLLTQDVKSRTLQVSMRFFTGSFVTDYSATIAMIVICVAPTILVYVLFQERIIEGMTSGAVKA